MSVKKLGTVLVAVLALSVVVVSSASAAATTTAAQWYTGTSPGTTLAGSAKLSAEIGSDPVVGKKVVLETEVGSPARKIKLTATGVSCSGCTIENKEVTSKAGKVAFGTGKIVFTGVTVDEPEGCSVPGGTITSKALTIHADFMNGTTAVQQFLPTSGTSFAAYELEGVKCPVAGLYSVTGTLFANTVNPTNTFALTQEERISKAIEESDGGGLFTGPKPAVLTVTITITVTTTTTITVTVK